MTDNEVKWFLVGNLLRRNLMAGVKKAEKYLYGHVAGEGETPTHTINGVGYVGLVLPALPEWDDETYPCAYIAPDSEGRTCFTATKTPLYYMPGGIVSLPVAYVRLEYTLMDTAWVLTNDGSEKSNSGIRPLIWTNTDVPYLTNHENVFFAKSDPIPIYGEPVAYLYNGVRLLKLPEWDKVAYPYAVIDQSTLSGIYRLHLFEHLPFAIKTDSGRYKYGAMDGSTYVYMGTCASSWTDGWLTDGAYYEDVDGISTKNILWTSFNLLYADGSVCLAASDPIPVYE